METTETEINPERLRFQASAEAQAITKLLAGVEVGGKVTYEEIITAAGAKIEDGIEPVRSFLYTAQRHLQREKNIIFDVITGVGIQRLADGQIVSKSKAKMDNVRRHAHRAAKTLACADLEKLTPSQKNEALCLQSQMGAVQLAASLKAQHQIQQKLEQGKRLEVGNIINFFKVAA